MVKSKINLWTISGLERPVFFKIWTSGNLVDSLTKISLIQRQGGMVERKKPMALWREESKFEQRWEETQDSEAETQ